MRVLLDHGTPAPFLGLSDEEAAYMELRLRLAATLCACREKKRLTQSELAKRIGSSQSRVAKMEAGDPSVSSVAIFNPVSAGVSR